MDRNVHLDLSRSGLKALPTEIQLLTHLTSLDISSNQLEALPPHIAALTSLRLLNIAHNHLQSIPWQICALTNLMKLTLTQNPRLVATQAPPCAQPGSQLIVHHVTQVGLRPDVIEREDAKKILSHFREPTAKYPCPRMKLLLVGQVYRCNLMRN